jgi:hypothetical protein
MLVNFRVDPEVLQKILPPPFRPKLLGSSAVAGICLIRLEQIRPRFLPAGLGLSSENAAHRMAVVWDGEGGERREGVYITRRDSSSRFNHAVGGRLFPGEHHFATFDVDDRGDSISLSMRAADGGASVEVRGRPAKSLPATSRFGSLEEASAFFEKGSLGYSDTARHRHLDGLYLLTKEWHVEPLEVEHVRSSFFDDTSLFPRGSVELDCALLMRNIHHEWHSAPNLPLFDQPPPPHA